MISKLKLYFKWGIQFGEPFLLEDRGARRVEYASRDALMAAVEQKYPQSKQKQPVSEGEFMPMDEGFSEKTGRTVKTNR